jgi:hypothetical protein
MIDILYQIEHLNFGLRGCNMSVKVIFCKWGNDKEIANEIGDCYILTPDNWDDYGYKTTFKVNLYKNGEKYGEYSRKILFQDEKIIDSPSYIEKMLTKSKIIDVKDVFAKYKFISLGAEYEELKKVFSENDEYIEILKNLNDVIYLENKELDSPLRTELLAMKEYEAFEVSLTRDQYSKKMLQEGKSLLFGEILNEDRFNFEFNFELNEKNYKYKFDFNKKEDLPHRINVLIGKNGSGKSQTLFELSEYFLSNDPERVDIHPAFVANMMVFAYNPHETFTIPRRKRRFNIDYKYLGLRRPKQIFDIEMAKLLESDDLYNILKELSKIKIPNLEEKIEFSGMRDYVNKTSQNTEELIDEVCQKTSLKKEILEKEWKTFIDILDENVIDINIPQNMTFLSFKDIYEKDRNNIAHKIQLDEVLYRDKIFKYINKAFNCSEIGLRFLPLVVTSKFKEQNFKFIDDYLLISKEIPTNYTRDLNFEEFENKLYFFNDGKRIYLSSGQQTFVDLIVNILALIKPNSLILIDEPENTLHPNLEVDFIKILQDILIDFDSFAIIATHSPTIVREVPENFVRVIKFDGSGQPLIDSPSIKTFGADIGTITNYVFDDIFKVDKPFENWFHNEKSKYTSFEEFEQKYKTYLNYDFLLYCKNAWDI